MLDIGDCCLLHMCNKFWPVFHLYYQNDRSGPRRILFLLFGRTFRACLYCGDMTSLTHRSSEVGADYRAAASNDIVAEGSYITLDPLASN
jgi:hypothetical protein